MAIDVDTSREMRANKQRAYANNVDTFCDNNGFADLETDGAEYRPGITN